MKKLICMILCIIMACGLCSCGNSDTAFIGTGTPGELDEPDWTEYDRLLDEANACLDLNHRSYLLHKAEDMLMDTGCLIPLFFNGVAYICKDNVKNAYVAPGDKSDITHIRIEGQDPSVPVGVYLTSDPENIDPCFKAIISVSRIVENTQSGLTKRDKDGNIICDLAESYEVSEDGKTYTFTLRDNLKWSDGSDLTAEDFVYSWKRITYSKNAFEVGELLDVIEGYPDNLNVEASPDGKKFIVHLSRPCAYFLGLADYTAMVPVKKEYVENADGYTDSKGNVVNPSAFGREAGCPSCGPYCIVTWKHNESMILKKNPYYYDAENIPTETIELMLSNDNTAIYGAYVAGDIAFSIGGLPQDIANFMKDSPEYHYVPGSSCSSVYINVKSDIFKGMTWEESTTFRKAVGYAVDREFITKVALGGNQEAATTYVSKEMNDGTGDKYGDLKEGYEYPNGDGYYEPRQNLAKARELLESIGYEFDDNGKLKHPITIEYFYNGASGNDEVAACLQADLAMLGINLTLRKSEFVVFLGERKKATYEMSRGSWSPDYDDPFSMLSLFTSNSLNNDIFLGRNP